MSLPIAQPTNSFSEALLLYALTPKEKLDIRQARAIAMTALGMDPTDSTANIIKKILEEASEGIQTVQVPETPKAFDVEASVAHLLNKTKTVYEVVGEIAALKRKLHQNQSTAMTQMWTKLTVALAFHHEKLPTQNPDILNQSMLPKLENLEARLKGGKRGPYLETRPHLKDSTADNPNWAEVLGNVPPATRALLRGVIAPTEKKVTIQNALWPEPEEAEVANARLNTILTSARGRQGNALKTTVFLCQKNFGMTLVESVEKNERTLTWAKGTLKRALKDLPGWAHASMPPEILKATTPMVPEEPDSLISRSQKAEKRKKIAYQLARVSNRLNTQKSPEGTTLKEIVNEAIQELIERSAGFEGWVIPPLREHHNRWLMKKGRELPICDDMSEEEITHQTKVGRPATMDKVVERALAREENPRKMLDLLKRLTLPQTAAQIINHATTKTIPETCSGLKAVALRWGLKNGTVPSHAEFGKNRVPLLCACSWWGKATHTATTLNRVLEDGGNIQATDKQQNNALHYAKSLKTIEVLLEARVDASQKNEEGEWPEDTIRCEGGEIVLKARRIEDIKAKTRKALDRQPSIEM